VTVLGFAERAKGLPSGSLYASRSARRAWLQAYARVNLLLNWYAGRRIGPAEQASALFVECDDDFVGLHDIQILAHQFFGKVGIDAVGIKQLDLPGNRRLLLIQRQ
jgi:hypothetical protein